MAMSLGLTTDELLSMVHNGVTPKNGTCPPNPLAQCTAWLEAKTMMHDFLIIYQSVTSFPVAGSCVGYGGLGSKIYLAKQSKYTLVDVLETIGNALTARRDEAHLLQGIALAIYADGSLDRHRAFDLGYGACEALKNR